MATKRKTTRRPKPVPPERRGRRGHKAVDDDPALREWLTEQLQQRPAPTLNELVEKSRTTGFSIGRTAIFEFRLAFKAEQERKRLMLDLAQEFNDSANDGNVLDVETAVSTLATSRIYQKLLERAELDAEAMELLDLFRKLQSSSSQRERTRFAVERGIRATMIRIRAQMQEILKKDPDTLRRVLAAIDQAANEVRG